MNWKEQSELERETVTWLGKKNPIGIWQLDMRGGDFVSGPHFVKIAKSVLESRFCAISSDFCDFTRFQPDFTPFRFFQAIQPVMHVLTRKIVRFYESKRDFNNLDMWYIQLVPCLVYGIFFNLFLPALPSPTRLSRHPEHWSQWKSWWKTSLGKKKLSN